MLISLTIFAAVMLAFSAAALKKDIFAERKINFIYLSVVLFIVKILISTFIRGYESDLGCFSSWSDTVYTAGMGQFYQTAGFADYPPGYIYVLYVIAFIKNLFSLDSASTVYNILLKLPAIATDMLCAAVIYKFAREKTSESKSITFALLFALNPMVILNSSWWGQVDSVFTLFAILALICLYKDKCELSAVFYALALLIKPQALIIFPVYLFYIFGLIKERKLKGVGKAAVSALCGAAVFFLFVLPFSGGRPLSWVFELYKSTLGSYEYASLNAPNLFSAFGGNAAGVHEKFLFMSYSTWSWIFICAAVVLSGFIYFKHGGIFPCASVLLAGTYVFGAKMHERYLFPVIAFIILCYICTNRRKLVYALFGFTFAAYEATAWVLALITKTGNSFIASKSPMFILLSFLSLASFAVLIYSFCGKNEKKEKPVRNAKPIVRIKHERVRFDRKDAIICLVIAAVYAAAEFTALGNTYAPQTFEEFSDKRSVILSLDKTENITRITAYNGRLPFEKDSEYNISFSTDGKTFKDAVPFSLKSVFKWEVLDVNESARYIKLDYLYGDSVYIGEIGVFSGNDKLKFSCAEAPKLCDEQKTVAYESSYMNGTYFDEIYHARTGYEFNCGADIYEWTHPPLGKIFIALGIKLFGMTPFGWRFAGAFFGVLIIPVIYIFAKEIFKSRRAAALAAILLSVDFMHFTMSRIATIDSFASFFALLMFLFMYKFMQTDLTEMHSVLKYLFLTGLTFGIGIAVKWTCVYSGAGLFVLFLIYMIRVYKMREQYENYTKKTVKIILCCVLYFVIIPALVYWVSYMPYAFLKSGNEKITVMFKIQKDMLEYHKNLDATHFFSSMWYQWPIMYKPIWFLSETYAERGTISSISAFGNPVIWWTSISAAAVFAAIFIKKARKGENTSDLTFLTVGWLAQYLPWFFVTRVVFIYHYYNSVPFIILILVYVIKHLYDNAKSKKLAEYSVYAFTAAAIIAFIAFFPVISGIPMSPAYARALTWFPTWYFGG